MGRAHAERLMTSAGTIKRQTGTTTDPVTYVETPVYGTTVYTGVGRVRMVKAVQGTTGAIPGAVAIKDELILSIPVDASGSEDVLPNDVWTCTANPLDPSIVGVPMRITGVHAGTYMTARRFPLETVN